MLLKHSKQAPEAQDLCSHCCLFLHQTQMFTHTHVSSSSQAFSGYPLEDCKPLLMVRMFLFLSCLIFWKIIYLAALGLSCAMRDLPLWPTDSLVVVCRLWSNWGSVVAVPGFSCSSACRILALWPGIKPVSPVLQDRFLTTEPLGKSPFLPYFILRHLSPPLILYILLLYTVYRPHSRI